jgi:hypothetical protein
MLIVYITESAMHDCIDAEGDGQQFVVVINDVDNSV